MIEKMKLKVTKNLITGMILELKQKLTTAYYEKEKINKLLTKLSMRRLKKKIYKI